MVMLRSPIDSRAGWEGGRNVLIGGDFSTNPWQRGFEFNEQGYGNDDGSYTADRWMLLSEGDRIVDVVRGADGEFTAVTRTPNRRFGVAQIIEAGNARALIGHRCSLSARVMGPHRAQFALALLGWAAAADHLFTAPRGSMAAAARRAHLGAGLATAERYRCDRAGTGLRRCSHRRYRD